MSELKEKIQEDRGVAAITNVLMGMRPPHRGGHHSHNMKLAGGAIIDILEDRIPKDYDIINGHHAIPMFEAAGFTFVSDSKTAVTYERGAMIVQFLKIRLEEFEYKISQASYDFIDKELRIDMVSWNNKTLIPVAYNPKAVHSCLLRLPHWRRKGYNIADVTYYSLVETLAKGMKSQDRYATASWGS